MNAMSNAVLRVFGVSLMSLVLVLGAMGCGGFDDDFSVGENGSVVVAELDPFIDTDGSFYTSLAHLLGRKIGADAGFHLLNNTKIQNKTSSRQTVFVQVYIPGFSEVGMHRVELAAKETKTIPGINVSYDYAALYDVTTPVATSLQVGVYDGEKLIDFQSVPIFIQPLTRFRWMIADGNSYQDMRILSVVYVTPEDRGNEIQRLLTEAAQYSKHKAIVGYQGNTVEDGLDQIQAVYNAVKARGMVYTNVPGSFFDGAQYVKLPAQSLRTNSANCIDGTFVFASAFEAMGMESFLIFMSGHAMIAVRAMKGDDNSMVYIETTVVSSRSFAQAIEAGIEKVRERISENDQMLLSVDVNAFRKAGFTPVNM